MYKRIWLHNPVADLAVSTDIIKSHDSALLQRFFQKSQTLLQRTLQPPGGEVDDQLGRFAAEGMRL
ncbi:hypothetical protein D3C87_1974520 [compost metagenome]